MKKVVLAALAAAAIVTLPLAVLSQTASNRLVLSMGEESHAISSAEGGDAYAPVVAERTSTTTIFKTTGPIAYSPMDLRVGVGQFSALVRTFAGGAGARFAATVQLFNGSDGSFLSGNTASNAFITEVELPGLVRSSSLRTSVRIRVQPGSTRSLHGPVRTGAAEPAASRFAAGDFRFEIPEVDCTGIDAIDPITIKQVDRGPIEVSNFSIAVPRSRLASWLPWYDNLVAGGGAGERTATIVYLNTTQDSEIGRVELGGVGIWGIRAPSLDAGAAAAAPRDDYHVDLYAETVAVR
jgi:hypothetical protein